MTFRWQITKILFTFIDKILFGVKVSGLNNIPEGSVIFAANHQSHLDPPLVGYIVNREVHFVAKEELFHLSRFFTWLISKYNAVRIKRDRDFGALKKIMSVLKNSGSVVIFPEGTRSKVGKILPFHSGVGMIALRSKVPVVPIYIQNTDAPLIDIFTRRKRLQIVFSAPMNPNGFPANKEGYVKFTEKLQKRIIAMKNESNNSRK